MGLDVSEWPSDAADAQRITSATTGSGGSGRVHAGAGHCTVILAALPCCLSTPLCCPPCLCFPLCVLTVSAVCLPLRLCSLLSSTSAMAQASATFESVWEDFIVRYTAHTARGRGNTAGQVGRQARKRRVAADAVAAGTAVCSVEQSAPLQHHAEEAHSA